MRFLLVDDSSPSRALFRAKMFAPGKPWMRDVELVDQAAPLERIEDYDVYDAVIFDQHLGIWGPDGEEITGFHVCQHIHAWQTEKDPTTGRRMRPGRPTALMLLTGDDYTQIPFNAREVVDQIAYKHGHGPRHCDDDMGCVRALMRLVAGRLGLDRG